MKEKKTEKKKIEKKNKVKKNEKKIRKKKKDKKKTKCKPKCTHETLDHRNICCHMMLSHVSLLIPCFWWIFGYNHGTHISHIFDKFLAIALASALIFTTTYHYYYECVFYYLEEQVMIFAIVFLNIYMVYRGVPYKYIGFGFLIILVLRACILKAGKETMDNENYEIYHPFCHYIGGIYVLYCVYFIQETFKKK